MNKKNDDADVSPGFGTEAGDLQDGKKRRRRKLGPRHRRKSKEKERLDLATEERLNHNRNVLDRILEEKPDRTPVIRGETASLMFADADDSNV